VPPPPMPIVLPNKIDAAWAERVAAECEADATAVTFEVGTWEGASDIGEGRLLQLVRHLDWRGTRIVLRLREGLPAIEEDPHHDLWKVFREQLSALILVQAADAVLDPQGVDRKGEISAVQTQILSANGGEIGFGRELALVRIDRIGAPRAFLAFDRREENFTRVGGRVTQLTRALNLRHVGIEKLIPFAHEAVENTLDHGRTDLTGERIEALRFMQIRRREIPRKPRMEGLEVDADRFGSYLRRLSRDEILGDERHAKFVELTVADCGVGISARLVGSTEIYSGPISEEKKKTLAAMQAGTSSKGNDEIGAGQGLSKALEVAQVLRGIFVVRTGRLELTYDASLEGGDDDDGWHVAERGYLPGTTLSLCAPWWEGAQGRVDETAAR